MLKPFLTLSVRLKISVESIAEEKMGVDNTDEFASKVTSDHVFKDLDADDLNRSVFFSKTAPQKTFSLCISEIFLVSQPSWSRCACPAERMG